MNYFSGISNQAQLKKEYRRLAIENHPDKGGDTRVMQEINAQFEKLYEKLKGTAAYTESASGYDSDYAGASAKEYTDYVYNEYRWKGSNYKGQRAPEVVDILRVWLKETYPRYKFSVTRRNYNSICIYLISADFRAFREGSEYVSNKQVNHFYVDKDPDLTDRAKEVLGNVVDFVNSYNFDDSDAMTDYFHTNFYLNVGIGSHEKPYKVDIPKLKCRKGEEPDVFRHPEGAAHKAIRQALAGCRFAVWKTNGRGNLVVLGTDSYYEKAEPHFWPKDYSSAKQGRKRVDKLTAAGIRCRLTGYNGGYIEFIGYTPETEAGLERERAEYAEAFRKWQESKNNK